jgi:ATP-dependent helicase/DNAse subunit B
MNCVLQCEHIYEEAACIADRICGLAANGARYKDIVVVICDYDETIAVYGQVFAESNIPVNIDIGMKLIDSPFAKYLRDLMSGAPWMGACVKIDGGTVKDICRRLLEITGDCVGDPVKEKIAEILETCAKILGGQYMTLSEFNNMFCALSNAAKISSVPTYLDRVLLVSAKEYEPTFVKHLFIAGANDGAFPVSMPDTDIITEQDIKNMSIRIEPSASLQNRRAFVHAWNILKSAVKDLCVSYSATTVNGERVNLSGMIERLKLPYDRAENFSSEIYARRRVLTAIGSGNAFEEQNAEYWASVQKAVGLGGMRIPDLDANPKNLNCGEKFFLHGNKISVTQLENFAKCPYYHFMVNGLGVKKREPQGITASMVGTILHKFAEVYVKDGTHRDIGEITRDILGQYNLPRFADVALSKQFKLTAKFLTEDIEKSRYKPNLFEYELEKEISGVTVRGVADRIDLADIGGVSHAVVVDYKSGAVTGPKLQLPLYMDFLKDKYIPDGSYYLSLKTFAKTKISPGESAPVLERVHLIINEIKNGTVIQKAFHKSVCEYCPAGAMCGRRL